MKEQTLASRKKNRNKRNTYSIKMKRCEKDLKIGKNNRKMEKGQKNREAYLKEYWDSLFSTFCVRPEQRCGVSAG